MIKRMLAEAPETPIDFLHSVEVFLYESKPRKISPNKHRC